VTDGPFTEAKELIAGFWLIQVKSKEEAIEWASRPLRGRRGRDSSSVRGMFGPYALQAAIAACHARARTTEETDWERIAALYEVLARLAPSPIVELNRAVALSMAFGPATASNSSMR
jgi:hypothetical protein